MRARWILATSSVGVLLTAPVASAPVSAHTNSATPASSTVVQKVDNVLTVTADEGVGNQITVRRQGTVIVVSDSADTVVAGAGCQQQDGNSAICPLPVDTVVVDSNDGDDAVRVLPNVDAAAVVHGGADDDVIEGGPRADRLIGDQPATTAGRERQTPGNDTINGGPGNDTISGLGGNDTINGNAGNDTLNGDTGNDTVNGNTGNDTVTGGGQNDTLNGNEGNDTLNARGDGAVDSLDGGVAFDSCNRDSFDPAVNCP